MLPRHKVITRYQGRHVRLMVVVEPWVTKQQLEELTKALAEGRNVERIDYFDFDELIRTNPSLGYWERFGIAALREKDWRKRPSPHDVQLWVERASIQADEEGAARALAAKHNLTAEMVKADIARVRDWIANADS